MTGSNRPVNAAPVSPCTNPVFTTTDQGGIAEGGVEDAVASGEEVQEGGDTTEHNGNGQDISEEVGFIRFW